MSNTITYKTPIPPHTATKEEFIRWRLDEAYGYYKIISGLSDIVYDAQKFYDPDLTKPTCLAAIESVMSKREFKHTLCTAINLDVLCENQSLLGPLQAAVWEDRGTFGVDENFITVAQIYGTIGISNAYNLDRVKPGIIGKIDKLGKTSEYCHTFLDDVLCAIAGAAMGKLAHDNDPGNPIPK